MRVLAGVLVVGLLAGCAPGSTFSLRKEPETVCAPLQGTRDMWATVRTIAGNRIAFVERTCAAGKLSPGICAQAAEDIQTLRALDFDITRKLDNPKAVLDVDKVIKVLEVSAKLVGALL